MATGDAAKKLCQNVARVQRSIEKCLVLYMNKKEVMNTLITQDHQDPEVAEIVWHRLEAQNPDFFKAYHLKVLVRQQIVEFNRLLSEQAKLMHEIGLSGMSSVPMSNGSDIPPTQQSSTYCAKQITQPLEKADMQQPKPGSSPNAFGGSLPIQSCMQGTLDVPSHGQMIDVSPNMMLSQNSNVPQTLNGKIVDIEPLYAGSLPYNFNLHNSFLGSCPPMGDSNIPSFTGARSSTRPLNVSVLGGDAYSFGFLEQNPQNFGLPGLAADFSDLLDTSSFQSSTDANNLMDAHGDMDTLNALSEALGYQGYSGDLYNASERAPTAPHKD